MHHILSLSCTHTHTHAQKPLLPASASLPSSAPTKLPPSLVQPAGATFTFKTVRAKLTLSFYVNGDDY